MLKTKNMLIRFPVQVMINALSFKFVYLADEEEQTKFLVLH